MFVFFSNRLGCLGSIAVSIVEPVYVAAGFSLYLNRRAILEGWDIELSLRRLDTRLRGLRAAAVVVLALACALAAPPPAAASEKSAKAEIKEVLKAPEFQTAKDAARRARGAVQCSSSPSSSRRS